MKSTHHGSSTWTIFLLLLRISVMINHMDDVWRITFDVSSSSSSSPSSWPSGELFVYGFSPPGPSFIQSKSISSSQRRRQQQQPRPLQNPKLRSQRQLGSYDEATRNDSDFQVVGSPTIMIRINIALTRELGNNAKLLQAIQTHPAIVNSSLPMNVSHHLKWIEMPCIEHALGQDFHCLQQLVSNPDILQRTYDYIVITSPESAHVLYQAMNTTTLPSLSSSLPPPPSSFAVPSSLKIQIAAVGKATQRQLQQDGFTVHFVPSQADGETLCRELPPYGSTAKKNITRVLYPASAKAADTIQTHLEKKRKDASFHVTRLNTYDTVTSILNTTTLLEFLSTKDNNTKHIVCFGSPSAVEAWLQNVDTLYKNQPTNGNGNVIAVCIGQTTATACLESKRWTCQEIFYPITNPGIEGWANSCVDAIQYIITQASGAR